MHVIIFGGSGFVGRYLAVALAQAGHTVQIATRNPHVVSEKDRPTDRSRLPIRTVHVEYSPEWIQGLFTECARQDTYAVINLAGSSISSGRWTKSRKQDIFQSRVSSTRAIVQAITRTPHAPKVFVSASAVGYYPYSESQEYTESSQSGDGFLPAVTKAWEDEALQADGKTRVCIARLGVVLGKDGGALPMMTMPYKLFLGGRIGSGRQWVPWIHVEDIAGLITSMLRSEAWSGAFNFTAPNPVRMNEFGKTLADVLSRPHWLPVPSFAMQALFGEKSEIVLKGQKVYPTHAMTLGYQFQFPTLDTALRSIFLSSYPLNPRDPNN